MQKVEMLREGWGGASAASSLTGNSHSVKQSPPSVNKTETDSYSWYEWMASGEKSLIMGGVKNDFKRGGETSPNLKSRKGHRKS